MRSAIRHLQSVDPVLAEIIRRVGPCRLAVREPTFETLARSIAFQQLNGKAAGTIFERLKQAAGPKFTAASLLRLSPEQLKACGLSRQKIASLTDLAEKVARRRINFRKLNDMPDEDVIEHLSRVRGVGVWTVQMFLMFALQRPNVLPTGDLGIRNAVRKAYGLPDVPKPSEVAELAQKWHPYCTIASWYLWRSLDGGAVI